MNAKIIVAFILGAAAGVASSMFYFKTKYEQKADAEIQEIRDLYAKKTETEEKKEDAPVTSQQATKADNLHATARHISEYTKYTPKEEPAEPQVEEPKDGIHVEKMDFAPMKNPNPPKPYRIDSTDYGQDDNFDPVCWDWYTDGVLANENDEVIDNIQEWIGDNLKVFAETEDNLFWVRNEKYGVDIEVARSGITYAQAQRWAEEDIRRVK